jgi:hypothetical protein
MFSENCQVRLEPLGVGLTRLDEHTDGRLGVASIHRRWRELGKQGEPRVFQAFTRPPVLINPVHERTRAIVSDEAVSVQRLLAHLLSHNPAREERAGLQPEGTDHTSLDSDRAFCADDSPNLGVGSTVSPKSADRSSVRCAMPDRILQCRDQPPVGVLRTKSPLFADRCASEAMGLYAHSHAPRD